LATRTGFFHRFSSAACSGNPIHRGCRFAADRTTPRLITPGYPTLTRSNAGICARSLSSAASSRAGVGGSGVGTRSRSVSGLPS